MRMSKRTLGFGAVAVLMMAGTANATSFSFAQITTNGNALIANQLAVDVTANGTQVDFKFTNNVGTASSITDIYFEKGPLFGITDITDSDGVVNGVAFTDPAIPSSLPSGTDFGFATHVGFSADSDNPPTSTRGQRFGRMGDDHI